MFFMKVLILTLLAIAFFVISRHSVMKSIKLTDESKALKDEKQGFISWFFFKKYRNAASKIKMVWHFSNIALYFVLLVLLILLQVRNAAFHYGIDLIICYSGVNFVPMFLLWVESLKDDFRK